MNGSYGGKRIASFTENKKIFSMFNQMEQRRKGPVARNGVHLQVLSEEKYSGT